MKARSLFQERNTASMASCSWAVGSCGNSMPASASTMALNRSARPLRSSAESSGSVATPRSLRSCSSACSNFAPSTSRTILANICTKRRYESYAKRGLSVCLASPPTDTSLSPRLRTVSIIPGIENAAPDRTDTSNGSVASPSCLPIFASRAESAAATSSMSPAGIALSAAMYARHASVLIVNPGGTGRPSLVISARLAPLPPSRNFCSLEPSSKAYTYDIALSCWRGASWDSRLRVDHEGPRELVVDALTVAVEVAPRDHAETEDHAERRDREREQ